MDRHGDTTRQAPVWVSILTVTLIVGAVAAALATMQRIPSSSPGASGQGALNHMTVLDISYIAGLAQPEGVSYSPDGSRIATLGVFTPCAPTPQQLSPCGHGLAVFDAVTGDLIRLSPIEPLLGIATSSAASQGGPYVSLYGIGWTPDSAWYGMVYSVFSAAKPSTPDDLQDSGLLLVNPISGVASLIRGDSGYFASLGDLAADHPIWDTAHQTQLPPAPLIPSLLYSWNSSNAPQAMEPPLAPISHLPSNVGTLAPVGNPDGASPFTIWQPGLLIGPGSSGLGGQRSAFVTTFPAWSSAGQRAGVFTAGVSLPTPARALGVVSASASAGTPHITYPDTFLAIPPRDLAVNAILSDIGAFGWAQIAWSPDGSQVASITCFARQSESVKVRDTLSGKALGEADLTLNASDPGCRDLEQPQQMGAYPHTNLTMAWSPDGHQLFLADAYAGTLTTWQVISTH